MGRLRSAAAQKGSLTLGTSWGLRLEPGDAPKVFLLVPQLFSLTETVSRSRLVAPSSQQNTKALRSCWRSLLARRNADCGWHQERQSQVSPLPTSMVNMCVCGGWPTVNARSPELPVPLPGLMHDMLHPSTTPPVAYAMLFNARSLILPVLLPGVMHGVLHPSTAPPGPVDADQNSPAECGKCRAKPSRDHPNVLEKSHHIGVMRGRIRPVQNVDISRAMLYGGAGGTLCHILMHTHAGQQQNIPCDGRTRAEWVPKSVDIAVG